jgi:UPF0755 protein
MDDIPAQKPKKSLDILSKSHIVFYGTVLFFVTSLFFSLFIKSPQSFPEDTFAIVLKGETLSGISTELKAKDTIRSSFLFKVFMTLFGGTRGLLAGDYYLEKPQNTIILAWRFSRGLYDLKSVRVTIPEGTNVLEMSKIFSKDLYNFNDKEFLSLASTSEGYLFPDTYYLLPNIEAKEVFTLMRDNFDEKIKELDLEIMKFNKPLVDIIKMASIVEEEGRTDFTRQMIAGILWRRLSIKMPLQVDAAFVYVNGKKDSKLITLDDLKIDSPYNTYVYRGLPPTPISNPGLNSIRATITPVTSKYFFYLSDDDGEMHYAITHDEHVANKEKYLR